MVAEAQINDTRMSLFMLVQEQLEALVARAPVKKLPLGIRPELIERIASHAAEKTEADAPDRVSSIGIARFAPGVRDKAAAGKGDETGIGGPQFPVAVGCHDGPFHNMAKPRFKGNSGAIPPIAGVFTPDRAASGLHGVAYRIG